MFKPDGVTAGEKVDGYQKGHLQIGSHKIKCDLLVNGSVRKAVLPVSKIDLPVDSNGYIKTNERLEAGYENIYATGDVNGISYLAHVASAQGIHVINSIKGIKDQFHLQNYPINIYTDPEMAQIGKTEQQLILEKADYKVSGFPLSANGKALAEGNADGMIRLLSDKKYGQVLGVQIIAHNATDMIAEAAAFMQFEGTIYDVAQTIHAHPTVSEIFMESGFDAMDQPIHF